MSPEQSVYSVFHPKSHEHPIGGVPSATVAATIASWTKNAHMLPKTEQDIMDFFKSGLSVVVYEHKKVVGHAAIAAQYPDTKQIEIGTVAVAPQKRGQGIGTIATLAVLQVASEQFPRWTPMAMANPASAGMFKKMGAVEMNTRLLSPDVFSLCVTCPKRPPQPADGSPKCCDTPYDLSPILTSFGLAWMSLFVWGGGYEK